LVLSILTHNIPYSRLSSLRRLVYAQCRTPPRFLVVDILEVVVDLPLGATNIAHAGVAVAEMADFIARYNDSTDLKLQWAWKPRGGRMAELEGKRRRSSRRARGTDCGEPFEEQPFSYTTDPASRGVSFLLDMVGNKDQICCTGSVLRPRNLARPSAAISLALFEIKAAPVLDSPATPNRRLAAHRSVPSGPALKQSHFLKLTRHYDQDVYTHAMNYPIQSSAWQVLALAILYVDQHARDGIHISPTSTMN
jgi:hypothetical protein